MLDVDQQKETHKMDKMTSKTSIKNKDLVLVTKVLQAKEKLS